MMEILFRLQKISLLIYYYFHMNMKEVLDAFQWRYATKLFDTEKKLSAEQLDVLLEAIRMAPTSFGLQPFEVAVVSNTEVREKLKAAGYNQAQITEASHVFVFGVKKNLDEAYVDKFIEMISETRGVKVEDLKSYADMMKGFLSAKSSEARSEWAARQAYIALGVLVTTAAQIGVDVCPMEGFDNNQFDQILELGSKNLQSVVIATVGFRRSDDILANAPKVRFAKNDIVIEVK